MNLENIRQHTDFFTDKGASQIATQQNAAKAASDPCATLTKKFNYELGRDVEGNLLETGEAVGDYIAIGYFKKGADIMYHNIEILADTDAATFECEVGTLTPDGTFTNKATMSTASDFVANATIPEPHSPALEEPTWIVAKLTGVVPASGKVSFYVPYIALA